MSFIWGLFSGTSLRLSRRLREEKKRELIFSGYLPYTSAVSCQLTQHLHSDVHWTSDTGTKPHSTPGHPNLHFQHSSSPSSQMRRPKLSESHLTPFSQPIDNPSANPSGSTFQNPTNSPRLHCPHAGLSHPHLSWTSESPPAPAPGFSPCPHSLLSTLQPEGAYSNLVGS